MNKRIIIIIFLSLSLLSSCKVWDNFTTYFNTYYNAQRLLKECEEEFEFQDEKKRINPRLLVPEPRLYVAEASAKELPPFLTEFVISQQKLSPVKIKLDSIITKGSKILANHPHSNYVEGSLYLMALSFFYQNNYGSSQIKCSELIDKFPDGDLSPDAHLLFAKNYLVRRQFEVGKTILSRTVDISWQKKRYDILSEAFRLQAELALYQHDEDGALRPYKQAIAQCDDNYQKAKWQVDLAGLYYRMHKFTDAAKAFAKVHDYRPDYLAEFEADLYNAASLMRFGEFEKSEKILDALENNGNYEEWKDFTFGQRLNLLRLKKQDSLYEVAVRFADSAFKQKPPILVAYFEKGMDYFTDNKYIDARRMFAKTRSARIPVSKTSDRMYFLLNSWEEKHNAARTIIQKYKNDSIANTNQQYNNIQSNPNNNINQNNSVANNIKDNQNSKNPNLNLNDSKSNNNLSNNNNIDSVIIANSKIDTANSKLSNNNQAKNLSKNIKKNKNIPNDTTKLIQKDSVSIAQVIDTNNTDIANNKKSTKKLKNKKVTDIKDNNDSIKINTDIALSKDIITKSLDTNSNKKNPTFTQNRYKDTTEIKNKFNTNVPAPISPKLDPKTKRDIGSKIDTTLLPPPNQNDKSKKADQEKQPSLAMTIFELARVHDQLGNADSARYYYDMAVKISPLNDVETARYLYVYALSLKTIDLKKSDSLMDLIVEYYPLTEYGQEAIKDQGYTQAIFIDTIADIYHSGLKLMATKYYDLAIMQFLKIYTNYPSSKYIPQSLYAIGWTYEKHKKNYDSALYYYQILLDKYPESPYSKDVRLSVAYLIALRSGGPIPDSLQERKAAVFIPKKIEEPDNLKQMDPNQPVVPSDGRGVSVNPLDGLKNPKQFLNNTKKSLTDPKNFTPVINLPKNPLDGIATPVKDSTKIEEPKEPTKEPNTEKKKEDGNSDNDNKNSNEATKPDEKKK